MSGPTEQQGQPTRSFVETAAQVVAGMAQTVTMGVMPIGSVIRTWSELSTARRYADALKLTQERLKSMEPLDAEQKKRFNELIANMTDEERAERDARWEKIFEQYQQQAQRKLTQRIRDRLVPGNKDVESLAGEEAAELSVTEPAAPELPPNPLEKGERLLSLFVSAQERDYLLGDLEEEYVERVETDGLQPARQWVWRQILRTIGDSIKARVQAKMTPSPKAPDDLGQAVK